MKTRTTTLAACALIGTLMLSACGSSDTTATTDTSRSTATATAPTATAAPKPKPTTTTAAPTTTAPVIDPTPADFTINLIVTESQCFNTAGGLVTVEPDVGFVSGAWEIDRDVVVVYEVLGGEAVEIFNVTISPDGTYSYDPPTISTPRCDSTLTATITNVLVR